MHVIAAKAVAFKEALSPQFKEYQSQILKNAAAMAKTLQDKGFRIVSGGTDNHLMLVDLRGKGITGKEAEGALEEAAITVNKNMIPFDPQKPFIASGIRIGTPAITTRGMKEAEMVAIGEMIARVLEDSSNAKVKKEVAAQVKALCERFPLYPQLQRECAG